MSCRRNGEILRLVSGDQDEAATQRLHEHFAQCTACAAAYDDARRAWQALGDWRVDAAHEDMTARVLKRVDGDPRQERGITYSFGRMGLLRAAASIALAAGLGVGPGTLLPTQRGAFATSDARYVVMESLGLGDLGVEGSTGLTLGFEPEPTDGAAGGVP